MKGNEAGYALMVVLLAGAWKGFVKNEYQEVLGPNGKQEGPNKVGKGPNKRRNGPNVFQLGPNENCSSCYLPSTGDPKSRNRQKSQA